MSKLGIRTKTDYSAAQDLVSREGVKSDAEENIHLYLFRSLAHECVGLRPFYAYWKNSVHKSFHFPRNTTSVNKFITLSSLLRR